MKLYSEQISFSNLVQIWGRAQGLDAPIPFTWKPVQRGCEVLPDQNRRVELQGAANLANSVFGSHSRFNCPCMFHLIL